MHDPWVAPGERLLISFCNLATNPRPTGLLHLRTNPWSWEWVDIGYSDTLVASSTGLCCDAAYVYHLSIAQPHFGTVLTVLDRDTLQVVRVQPLPQVHDGHSLARYGDELLVVSTGTDEIVAYRLTDGEVLDPRTMWSPTGSGTDEHHVNCVTLAGGDVLCSAFGPKLDDRWSSHGYVYNITRDRFLLQGLHQPHSVTAPAGNLHVCNSMAGTVETENGVLHHLAGYSRGLAMTADGGLFAGTSVGRRGHRARQGGQVFLNPSDTGPLHGRCAIVHVPAAGGPRIEAGLGFAGLEIYDIMVI